jgi:hypothetical protein
VALAFNRVHGAQLVGVHPYVGSSMATHSPLQTF